MTSQPIKRSEYLVQLSRDHHTSLLFCWKIRQGIQRNVSAERISNYIQYFWQHHLQPHFEEEERFVFILSGDEKIGQAMKEHAQIREQVEQVLLTTDEKVVPLLSQLATAVDRHVRFEERVLFPYLEQSLSEAQLKSIASQLTEASSIQDNYPDAFWKPA